MAYGCDQSFPYVKFGICPIDVTDNSAWEIKEDSIIELEKYREYNFTRTLDVTEYNQFIKIDIPNNIGRIYAHDITVVDETTRAYLEENVQYKILTYSDVVQDEIELDSEQYSIIKGYFKKGRNNMYTLGVI